MKVAGSAVGLCVGGWSVGIGVAVRVSGRAVAVAVLGDAAVVGGGVGVVVTSAVSVGVRGGGSSSGTG